MHKISVFLGMLLMTSCTFNVSMAHTTGTATDVIDDTQTNKPDITSNVSIPLMK